MKKLALLIAIIIGIMNCELVLAQQWNLAGNNTITPPTEFLGTTDGTPIPFFTNNNERMRLTPTGWFGINISAPEMMFHVDDGGILSTGAIGTNPDLNAGTRLMWIPDQGAFRAGSVSGAQWDGGNVGNSSVAFGQNNIASGARSVAFGIGNEAAGTNSFIYGLENSISTAAANASALGVSNTINATGGFAVGLRNTVTGDFGVTIGSALEAQEESSIVLGSGIDGTSLLLNDISNSLMVGFNSTVSTLFVGPPEGEEVIGSVGIGDVTEPTERVDVRGTARFRVMEEAETPDVVITGMKFDEEDGDYVLHYSNLDNVQDCTWDKVNGDQDLAMGYTNACVEGSVLIGTDQPQATKVYVTNSDYIISLFVESEGTNGNQIGGYFNAEQASASSAGVVGTAANSPSNFGVTGGANTEGANNTGVRGTSSHGNRNYGLVGSASSGQIFNYGCYSSSHSPSGPAGFGVYSRAIGPGSEYNVGGYFYACDAEKNIGIYAEVCDTASSVAGYFVGNVLTSQSPITFSDESLKLELNEIETALETINQLQPMQYYFNTTEYPHLQLDKSLSYGFSAQQLQEILPEMVKEVHHPAKYDSTGVLITPGLDVLGVQYQQLIPILTAGIKEQQAQIQSQDDQIAGLQETMMQMQEQMQMMQDQINGCCQGDITPKNSGMGQDNSPSEKSFGQNELYQNTPNPFRSQTTISYTLEQGGKVLLNIFDKTGKPIATLVEAEQQADTYRYEWDASGLPAGLYHYALYVDGELLVKKAIKLAD